jgi:hypothetical protein
MGVFTRVIHAISSHHGTRGRSSRAVARKNVAGTPWADRIGKATVKLSMYPSSKVINANRPRRWRRAVSSSAGTITSHHALRKPT